MDRTTVDHWRTELESLFSQYMDARRSWRQLLHRELQANVDPKLRDIAAYYETPDIEEELFKLTGILQMNPTEFDYVLLGDGTRLEERAQDTALWVARGHLDINKGRKVDRQIGEGQGMDGCKVQRLMYRPPTELDGREEYGETDGMLWYTDDVDTLSVRWLPRGEGFEYIIWDAEVPIASANEDYRVSGKQLGGGYNSKLYYRPLLDDSNKLVWVGDDVSPDDSQYGTSKLVRRVICEYLDKTNKCPVCPEGHPLWAGVEYLLNAAGEFKTDGIEVNRYTLPYRHAPTLRVIAGRRSSDRNPHFRYRPALYPLFVEATIINWLNTVLMTLANRDSSQEQVYATLKSLPEAAVGRMPEVYWDTMSVPLPRPGAKEAPIVPGELLAWPTKLVDAFLTLREDALRRFEAAKINRFIMGEAFQEAREGTGSANLSQLQQARLPFNPLLMETDQFWLELYEDILHAIRYWDHEEPKDTQRQYPVIAGGEEPLARHRAEPGTTVNLTAAMLGGFRLKLKTENETLQEQIQREQHAWWKFERGFIDDSQLVKEWGYADAEAQLRRINDYRLYVRSKHLKEAAQLYVIQTLFSSQADLDPALFAPAPPSDGAEAPPQGGGVGQPSVRLPALNGPAGGTSPVGGL